MNLFQKSLYGLFNILYPVKYFGRENIPEGSAVLLLNHFRSFDCGYFVALGGKDLGILAKNELFKNKLVSKFLLSFGAIPVDRQNPSLKSLMVASKVLKKGNKLCIFPEGTRNKTGSTKMLPLKDGAFTFSLMAKCPIVPIMQYKKSGFLRRQYILVGKPFELTEFYDKKIEGDVLVECNKIVTQKMEETHAELISKLKEMGKIKVKKGKV